MDVKLEAIRIVTRCTSRDQFVAMFSRYCTTTSCFIPSSDSWSIGTATAFTIRLADGALLLRGEGVVLDCWSHGDHSFRRPGIHLGIHRLDDACAELFEQLNHPRSTAIPIPPRTQLQMMLASPPSVVSEVETPTIEMPPLALPEEPRIPSSPFVLPANPLTEMTDDLLSVFVECNLVAEDVAAPVLPIDSTIPTEIPSEPTVKTREVIATILGVAPLTNQVFAAPQPVITELIDRVESPLDTPTHEPAIASAANVDAVAITYAASPHAAPAPTRPPTPKPPVKGATLVPSRPRQRLRLSALGVVPTQIERGPSRGLGRLPRRIAKAVVTRLRRWWLPATVATTILATTAAVLIV